MSRLGIAVKVLIIAFPLEAVGANQERLFTDLMYPIS